MTNDNAREQLSRRGVLKGTAAAAGTAAFAGTAGAYREVYGGPLPAVQPDVDGRTFVLVGIVGGWQGVEPAEIDGQSGPTLRLVEGEEHEVVWVNGDGSHHNFVVADEEGEVIEATEMTEELGEVTELSFTAEEGMTQYYCEPHPVQMRGPVELVDSDEVHELAVRVEDGDGNPLEAEVFLDDMHSFSDVAARPEPDEPVDDEEENADTDDVEEDTDDEGTDTDGDAEEDAEDEEDGEDAEDDVDAEDDDLPARARFDMLEDGEYELEVWTYGYERVTETVTIDGGDEEITVELSAMEPEEPAETYVLTLQAGEWIGQEPDAIADESNPTLEFEAGESYAVEWENGIGRLEDEERWGEPLPGHNFVISSGGETDEWNTYVRSNFTDEAGESQTVEFVAEEEMEVYLDQSQLEATGEVIVE